MTNEELIKELQHHDPRAEVRFEDYDKNWNFRVDKVDYQDGDVVIIGDEDE